MTAATSLPMNERRVVSALLSNVARYVDAITVCERAACRRHPTAENEADGVDGVDGHRQEHAPAPRRPSRAARLKVSSVAAPREIAVDARRVPELARMKGRSHGAERTPSSPLEDRHAPAELGDTLELVRGRRDRLLDEYDPVAPARDFRLVDVSGRRAANAGKLRVDREERFGARNGSRSAELRQCLGLRGIWIEDAHDGNAGRSKCERVHAAGGSRPANGRTKRVALRHEDLGPPVLRRDTARRGRASGGLDGATKVGLQG
jgi:hypothetical protein